MCKGKLTDYHFCGGKKVRVRMAGYNVGLDPCQICGGIPKAEQYEQFDDGVIMYYIQCSHCRCSTTTSNDFQKVADVWNSRVSVN